MSPFREADESEWTGFSRALAGARASSPVDEVDPYAAPTPDDLAAVISDEVAPPAKEDRPSTDISQETEDSEWTRFSRALGGERAAPPGDKSSLPRGMASEDEVDSAYEAYSTMMGDDLPSSDMVQEGESEESYVSEFRERSASPPTSNESPIVNRLLQQLDPQLMGQDGDEVDCSVFAPPRTPAGNPLLVQVVAHLPEDVERARQLAEEFDTGAARRGLASLTVPIAGGALLGFELRMRDLRVDEPFQTARWRGRPALVQFVVDVPVEHRPGVAVGRILVSCDGLPVGSIAFRVDVLAADAHIANDLEPAGMSPRRYRQAFISYAAADRDEVLKRVQVLPRVGVRCFQDILELEPGQRWENQLYRLIDESDLFLLFWSSAAQSSEWVGREIDYALRRKNDDDDAPPEIVPVPIEGPPPILPPPQLAHLHFDDRTRYFMHRSP